MSEHVKDILDYNYDSFFLVAGPCAIEDASVCTDIAGTLVELCEKLNIPLIFKGSIRKANRTKHGSFSGIGDDEALEILSDIKGLYNIPVTTDVHETQDVTAVKDIVDVIQIPAFLCRQTELLLAAGRSQKVVNIKKGQFMSGDAMLHAAEKVRSVGNDQVFLTERGNSWGYQDLIVDGRNVDHMAQKEIVIMDATHSTQKPNQGSGVSGGNPADVELMGRIGLASGAKGIFMEVHPNPKMAKSDASSMLKLSDAKDVVRRWRDLSTSLRSIYG